MRENGSSSSLLMLLGLAVLIPVSLFLLKSIQIPEGHVGTVQSSSTPTPLWTEVGVVANVSLEATGQWRRGVSAWISESVSLPVMGVAEVEVVDVDGLAFNTNSGGTPEPGTDGGWSIGQTVVLNVSTHLEGGDPNVDGLVVWQWGGELEGREYAAFPSDIFSVGDTGILVYFYRGLDPISTPRPPSFSQSNDRAVELSVGGQVFEPAIVAVFYEYAGNEVLSYLDGEATEDGWVPQRFDRTVFDHDVQAALGN